MATPILN